MKHDHIRNTQASACDGKKLFTTRAEAAEAVRISQRHQVIHGDRVHSYQIYQCPYGRHWHVTDRSRL